MKVYTHPKYSYVDVIEVPILDIKQIDFDTCEQPKETLGHYYNRMTRKPEILINAGIFNPKTGEPCFGVIDDGVLIKDHYGVREGIGTTKGSFSNLAFGVIDDGTPWYDFMAGYPVLVKHGAAITSVSWGSELDYNATRSVMGYNESTLYFVTVNKPGMKFIPLANLMKDLGCQYAINLDGGGSSRALVNGKVINKPTENRSVDTVCAVYLLTEEEKNPVTEEAPYVSYTVKQGDSLWKIATEYLGKGTRFNEIVDLNKLSSTSLRIGQVLKIPVDCERYVIVKGDTLYGIAARKMGAGVKYVDLAKFNNIDPKATLSIGQVIYIPV